MDVGDQPRGGRRRGLRRRGRSRPRGGPSRRLGRLADEHHEAILVHGGEDAAHERVGRAATHVAKSAATISDSRHCRTPICTCEGWRPYPPGATRCFRNCTVRGSSSGASERGPPRYQRSPSASGAPNSGRSCRRDPSSPPREDPPNVGRARRGGSVRRERRSNTRRRRGERQLKLFQRALRTTTLASGNFTPRACDIFS